MTEGGLRCAVVGGGIVGMFCAYYLLQRGHRVTLYERFDKPFQGATAAGFGSLTPYSDPFFRGDVSRFARESVELYRREIVPALSAFGPIDLSGDSLLHLIEHDSDMDRYVGELERRGHRSGLDFRVLSAAEAVTLEPNLSPQFEAAIEYMEPWIDTSQLLPALLAAVQGSPRFELLLGHRVTRACDGPDSVMLHDASACERTFDQVVVASGAGLSDIAGLPTPRLRLIRGDAVMAQSPDGAPLVSRHVYMGDAFITPRLNGEHLLGASYDDTDHGQGAAKPATERNTAKVGHTLEILKGCSTMLPKLAQCDITRLWHGWRPSTACARPYMGLTPGCSRVWSALGFIGLGVTLAPAVGAALARAMEGDATALPPALNEAQDDLWSSHGQA